MTGSYSIWGWASSVLIALGIGGWFLLKPRGKQTKSREQKEE